MKLILYLAALNVLVIVTETLQNVSHGIILEERIYQIIPMRTSCMNRCQTPLLDVSDCACDDECLFYGDCCHDYLYYCRRDGRNTTEDSSFARQLKISGDKTKPRWNCVTDPERRHQSTEGILIVITCPPSWNLYDIRNKCEIKDRKVVNEDLVFDSRGYIYANRFCAICNSDISSNDTSENNSTLCDDSPNCLTEYVVDDISRDTVVLRPCSLQLVDTCLPYTSEYLLFGCTAFTMTYIKFDYSHALRTYKNDLCEMCNIQRIQVRVLSGSGYHVAMENRRINIMVDAPIRIIFGGTNERPVPVVHVVEKARCNNNEYYDATSGVCQRCENGTVISESDYLTAVNDNGFHIDLLDGVILEDDLEIDIDESGSGNFGNSFINNQPTNDRILIDEEGSVCITSCNVIKPENKINSKKDDNWITLTTNNSKLSCRVLKNDMENVTIENKDMFSYSKAKTYVNIVVCVISLISLFVSILTLFCFPSLLNLPGLCRLCLMISLFLAQFIMLTIAYVTKPKVLCIGTAAVMHYFWLAMFCWTNVLAFDLARVFGTKASRPSTSKKRRLRFFYMLYGWGLPLVIVATCLALHIINIRDFRYGGNALCWFANRNSLLFAFGIPVSIFIAMNFILYIFTVVGIWKVSRVTEFAVREEERRKKRRDELKLYIKLSILMGVTWSLVFVTVYYDKTILWYIFIILNGLQGFFVFIAFTCNRQTFTKWSGVYLSHIESQSGSRQLTKTTSV